MNGYLGSVVVPVEHTPYAEFTPADWALYFIEQYGQFDGGHHKQWTMDQVVRVLKGTPVIVEKASWDNGHSELRVETGEPSAEYLQWVKDMRGEYNEEYDEYEYGYDEGIAP